VYRRQYETKLDVPENCIFVHIRFVTSILFEFYDTICDYLYLCVTKWQHIVNR